MLEVRDTVKRQTLFPDRLVEFFEDNLDLQLPSFHWTVVWGVNETV
jgi:hypothetical protein